MALLAVEAPADAAARVFRVEIGRKPARAALIDFALQAGLSLGGDLDACKGETGPLIGRMTVDAALARLLTGTHCAFSMPAPQTVVIRAAAPPPPAPSPQRPPAPPPLVAPPSIAPLGEIVITAQRYPNLPGRTPYAITALSGADLARANRVSLQDMAGQIAGMTVTNLGPGRDKILLRGLSDGAFTGQTQSIVALYLDDVPVTYNAPDPDLRLADVERVEVMRGPQGTLYGGGSIGGVVRVATRKPDLEQVSGHAIGGLSSTQGGGLNTEVELGANIPIVSGRIAARAVAYRETQAGYIDNPLLGLKNVNSSTRDGARLALKFALTPGWNATAAVTHQSINNDDTQYGLRRLGSKQRDIAVREPHDNDFDQGSLTVTGEGGWGRLTGSVAHLSHLFDSQYDATAGVRAFGGPAGPAAFTETKTIDLTVSEFAYASPPSRRLHGLAGVFLSTGETGLATSLTSVASPLVAVYGEARTDKVNEVAVYGEATYEITPKLSATVGLRWFDFQFKTASTVTQPAGRRAVMETDDAAGLSPKVLLSYRTEAGNLYYLQAAEGFRPGGFNTAGRIGQPVNIPGAPQSEYLADELWNYEAGAKFRWWDDRLQLRAAAFYATWEAVQSDQYLGDGTGFTANIGNGSNRGVEIEAAWRVNDRLDVRAAALINDPQITRADPAFNARRDAGLPGVSSASAGVTLDYRKQLPGDRQLRLLGQATYVGNSHLTFDAAKIHGMGDYIALTGSAALDLGAWTVTASIDNPLNTASNSFSFGNPFLITGEQVVTPLRPRTLIVRLSTSF